MAMCFNEESSWVVENLGPKSGHWKRLTRMVQSKEESMGLDQLGSKRPDHVPTMKLEQNTVVQKRRKTESKTNNTQEKETDRDGEEVATAQQCRRAK